MRISRVGLRSSTSGGGFGKSPILIRFEWAWKRKPCQLICFTFYRHAQCGICDESLFRLVHNKRSEDWQPHVVAKNKANSPHSRDWWLWKHCRLFLESSINSSNGSPRILAGLLRKMQEWRHQMEVLVVRDLHAIEEGWHSWPGGETHGDEGEDRDHCQPCGWLVQWTGAILETSPEC